jgi:hypothetical protein
MKSAHDPDHVTGRLTAEHDFRYYATFEALANLENSYAKHIQPLYMAGIENSAAKDELKVNFTCAIVF